MYTWGIKHLRRIWAELKFSFTGLVKAACQTIIIRASVSGTVTSQQKDYTEERGVKILMSKAPPLSCVDSNRKRVWRWLKISERERAYSSSGKERQSGVWRARSSRVDIFNPSSKGFNIRWSLIDAITSYHNEFLVPPQCVHCPHLDFYHSSRG